jgi:Phage stabilisation protein
MQIPILSGIYADSTAQVRTAYPVNLIPVPTKSGISNGYLRPGYGLVSQGAGVGVDRGGIEWNGVHYRVQGTKLVSINAAGTITVLGDVGSGGWCSFDYSFDRLAVSSGGRFYYWSGSVLTQVTDADLGTVVDHIWVDGYHMTTDGAYLVVTELTDPTQVNPLKYGSSEVDPDPVVALKKLRGEVYAVNRHTVEIFSNVGGEGFPFSRVEGAQIPKGAIGTHAVCVFADVLAFLGSGRNEPPAVYLGASGSVEKISTQEIDNILSTYTEDQLSGVVLEAKQDASNLHLYIHLPDRCVVYDLNASKAVGESVWFTLTSAMVGHSEYRAKGHVWVYDKWHAGDPTTGIYGYLSDSVSSHWGDHVRWEFGTTTLYNEGRGAIVHQTELVPLSGHAAPSDDPQIGMAYSNDGELWSLPRYIKAGKMGERAKRLCWFQCGMWRNWRVMRFTGDSRAHASFLRLELQVEGLVY